MRLPIHHLYYTLEYDMDAMIEQQQLEESDNIQQEQESQAGGGLTADNMLAQLGGPGNLSMKYLLGAIESNRAATGLSDRELRTLLSDVRPNRSKWANEDKVGQEELYEGCERVLMELRNYTEHSTPFLNKVNKREAPDYAQVIAVPMDLGTVLKKLKALAYQSKAQFAADLYLIYSNCLTYNSDPSSVYRKHAIAMKKRTQVLLETVQDVVIRDRADVEAEQEESDDEQEVGNVVRPNESAKGLGRKEQNSSKTVQAPNGDASSVKAHGSGASATSASKRGVSQDSRMETPKLGADQEVMSNATPTRDVSREPSTMESIETPFLGNGSLERSGGLGRSGTPNGLAHGSSPARQRRMSRASVPIEIDLEQEEKDIAAELNANKGDILFQEWKERTKKARAKVCSDRESQQRLPFQDRFALERSPWEMRRSLAIDMAHDRVFDSLTPKRKKKKKRQVRLDFGQDRGTMSESTEEEHDDDPFFDDVYGERDATSKEDEVDEGFVRDLFAPQKLREEDLQKKSNKNTSAAAASSELFLPEYAVRAGLPELPFGNSKVTTDPEHMRKLFDESEITA